MLTSFGAASLEVSFCIFSSSSSVALKSSYRQWLTDWKCSRLESGEMDPQDFRIDISACEFVLDPWLFLLLRHDDGPCQLFSFFWILACSDCANIFGIKAATINPRNEHKRQVRMRHDAQSATFILTCLDNPPDSANRVFTLHIQFLPWLTQWQARRLALQFDK